MPNAEGLDTGIVGSRITLQLPVQLRVTPAISKSLRGYRLRGSRSTMTDRKFTAKAAMDNKEEE